MIRRVVALCGLCGLIGCVGTPRLIVPDAAGAEFTGLETLVAAHPLPAGENILAAPIGRTDALSYHLVQIRDRERPHVHTAHDLVVTLLRGTGTLYVRGIAHKMRPGATAVVPRGTPHYFVNSGCKPVAAFVTFAPPYDGKDQVPVE